MPILLISPFPSPSHRSPWSNTYEPAIEDGFLPSEKLRNMEIEFNELFDAYREMYFEGGTSSVYLWDQDQGFAGCFLIKKSTCLSHHLTSLFKSTDQACYIFDP